MMVVGLFSLSIARDFPNKLQRKWTSKTVNVIVKKQIDHNFPLYNPLYHRNDVKMFESLHAVKPLAVPLEFWNLDVMSMEDESSKHAVLSKSVMST